VGEALEAARRLGWPIGTVKSRQVRGRERLRGRLIRRGLAPASGTIIATLSAGRAGAAVPASLVDATVKVAALVSGGQAAAGAISATAAVLMWGAIRAKLLARLRLAAGMALLLGAAVTTTGLAIHSGAAVQPPPPSQAGAAARTRANEPSSRPVLDALRPADISPEKRLADLPESTVAVLGEVRGRHAGEVRGLALSPDGKLLATVSDEDKRVRLWDAETLLPTGSLIGHRAFVNCVAISPDGRWLASGGAYGDFFLWDMSVTPPKGPTVLATHGKDRKFNNLLHATAFSPDGRILAVAGDVGGVELFDMAVEPTASRGVLPGLDLQAHSLTFSPDGKLLALAGLEDGSVCLCDVAGASPKEKAALKLPEREGVVGVRMAPRLDGGGGPAPVVQMVVRNRTPLVSAAFSPDGAMLAALDRIGSVWRWDLAGEAPAPRWRLRYKSEDRADAAFDIRDRAMIVFSHDGKMIVAAQPDGWIRLWDREGAEPTERATFPAHKKRVTAGVFRRDGRTLISGGGDHLVRSWDTSAATPEEKLKPQGPIGGLGGVTFSPDGTRLAVKDIEFIRLWDLTDARGLSRLPSPTTRIGRGSGHPLVFRPDGKSLFAGGDILEISGRELGRPLIFPPLRGLVWSLSLSADGQTLATGGQDRKARI
jgi:WD40 repeat protein